MTINAGTLELTLAKLVEVTTSTQQLMFLSKAIEQIKTGSINTAGTFSALPAASSSVGQLWFVSDSQTVYFSSIYSTGWVAINSTSIGQIYTWGSNATWQLGDSSTTDRSSPGTVYGGGTSWTQVAAGSDHMVALKSDGTFWGWGRNHCAQVACAFGGGPATQPTTPVGGGTTWCWVAAGNAITAGIKTDGRLWGWGRNYAGNLGTGTSSQVNSPMTTVGGGTTWCKVSLKNNHSIALKTDGTLWAWGYNIRGQVGDSSTTNRCSPVTTAGGGTTWCAISAGYVSSAAIKTDGTLWTWGGNYCGQLGNGSAGSGQSRSSPGTTAGCGTTWCSVSMGSHTLATKTDGTLWTWGRNDTGQLGDGTTVTKNSPITVAGGGTTWCMASSGSINATSAAIKTDGTLWTWGNNSQGALGDGTTTSRSSPGTTAGGGTFWSSVAVTADSACGRSMVALKKNVF